MTANLKITTQTYHFPANLPKLSSSDSGLIQTKRTCLGKQVCISNVVNTGFQRVFSNESETGQFIDHILITDNSATE